MPNTKVIYGQTLADLADEDKIFAVADLNGIGITDDLTPGEEIQTVSRAKISLSKEIVKRAVLDDEVKSLARQTWVDMALQQLGDEERLFELADLNGVGITDELEPGTVVSAPKYSASKQKIVNVLQVYKPASAEEAAPGETLEGIEYWAIEYDFIVS